MAVDRESRTELANHLRLLVDGQLSHSVFCDLYYGKWERNDDEAVRQVAKFGHGLYSDDLPPFKLKRVSQEIREMADRAILFLRSELEYAWPVEVFRVPYSGYCLTLTAILAPIALIFLIVGLKVRDFPWVFEWTIVGLLAVIAVVWILDSRAWSAHNDTLQQYGDLNAWPFLRRSEYESTITSGSTSP